MRVGISFITHAGHSIWENGLGQNVFLLAQLLQRLPVVEEVILLDCGDQGSVAPDATIAGGFRIMRPREATYLVDVAIEMGGGLDVQWLDQLRAMGRKVVFHCCGQPYVSLIEPTLFGTQGYTARLARCDELWILNKDANFAPMLEAMHRYPVHIVPYLWDPCFLEACARVLETHNLTFGYSPRATEQRVADGKPVPRALRVAVFEPNISVVKSCVIPMLVTDVAYRRNPDTVDALHVLNSVHMKEHLTFVRLSASLDPYRASRLTFEQRHDFAGYMSQHGDAVISHQWKNRQNSLYLDALYGGYPLVSDTPYSEIWTLPAFLSSCAAYYGTALRAPVKAMQHLWSPVILERTMRDAPPAQPFGYVPGRARWRLAVLEPNICVVKTSHVPMLAADVAHRQDSDMIEVLRVYNTAHLKENPQFYTFARSMDLVRHGIASFEARFATYEVMALHADAIVSHHWENAQNYLYCEALYGGYPLIHNSDLIDDCGYRYDSFDCMHGALVLREAHACHDA